MRFKRVWEILFPSKCIVCGKVLSGKRKDLCETCEKELPWIEGPTCMRCGKPIAHKEDEYCFDCSQKKDFVYQRGYALWIYDKTMKQSIARLKYGGDLEHVPYYGEQLVRRFGKTLSELALDVIVPVPLHPEKEEFRGFNQATEVAKILSQGLQVPCREDILIRKRQTTPQKGLSHQERKQNVQGAFQIAKGHQKEVLRWNRVLIFDDIYTTGNTINECAKVLWQHGVREIYFLCLCTGKDI